ncbi:enoyl-CoA hydratase/isomerase family protein [Chachezhania antarctica]|uniref:enoyl-CoA hydratase/isomerase family protein n=1 Tax=Chachezhania antarctica TaxID=2340860 RepID=UPI0013CE94C2|nr:enoyl-CoA hydratase/isomerase family protein [Chachezhania antarctica]
MSDLIVTEENGILWASINRPDKGSAISRAVTDGYVAAIGRLAEEPELKGLIWTSESERVFSGGIDLKVPEGMSDADAGPYRVSIVRDLIDATVNCPRPIVVMARGKMLGGAFMNALLTDRIVADDSATFQMPEVKIGLASPYSAAIVECATNKGLAYDICMSARRVPARELQDRGGPCTVVVAETLRDSAIEALETYAAMPAEAFGYMKRWFQIPRIQAIEAALAYSAAVKRA